MHFTHILPRHSIMNLSLSIFAGLMLASCKFEPSIPPLQFPTAPPQPFQQYSLESPDTSPTIAPGPTLSSEPATLDVKTVLSLCGQALSWGDETVGMCLAPGGASYFVWTEEGTAIHVPIDSLDISQAGFREAAEARARAIEDVRDEVRSIMLEGIGFGVSLMAFGPACATILGCAADVAALAVTGGMLAESGRSIIANVDTYGSSLTQAHYFYCRMQGTSDSSCRDLPGTSDDVSGD